MESHPLTPEERFAEFQRHIGKQCASLDDLDWDSIKAFLERISSLPERVDFLAFISKLPDGGVVNDTVVDPARHHRNMEAIRRPLDQERTRLLSQHFDLQRIRQTAEQIPNHLEAVAYLRETLESYIDYHPTIRRGSYSPEELTFVKTIESKIQLRKDLHAASSQSSSTPAPERDVAAHANQLYERVKGLANDVKPLDESSARLIVELADDAIKEFGNTNQEKKVELRRVRERAEEALPPKTIEELRKRAEGKALEKAYPRNKRIRNAVYSTIVFISIAAGLLALRQSLSGRGDVVKTNPSPTPPLSSSTKQDEDSNASASSVAPQIPSESMTPISRPALSPSPPAGGDKKTALSNRTGPSATPTAKATTPAEVSNTGPPVEANDRPLTDLMPYLTYVRFSNSRLYGVVAELKSSPDDSIMVRQGDSISANLRVLEINEREVRFINIMTKVTYKIPIKKEGIGKRSR